MPSLTNESDGDGPFIALRIYPVCIEDASCGTADT